jgi:hypothetical protein
MTPHLKHAFLITAYRDCDSLKSLFEQLMCIPNAKAYCHIDARSSDVISEIKQWLSQRVQYSDRIYVQHDEVIRWGSSDHLIAQLSLAQLAFQAGADYFHTMTGQCRIVSSIPFFCDYFEKHIGNNFIESFPLPSSIWPGKGGLERIKIFQLHDVLDAKKSEALFRRLNKHFIHLQRLLRINRLKHILGNKAPFGGSSYWSLHKDAIQAIILDDSVTQRKFKHTFCSEEIIPHTIVQNTKTLSGTLMNKSLRFILWERSNGEIPGILDQSHYSIIQERIKENPPIFFARKFDSAISSKLLIQLNQDE